LRAVRGLQALVAPLALLLRAPPAEREPAAQPAGGEARGGGEGGAVEARDRAQHRVLHLAGGRRVELAQPGALAVPVRPDEYGGAQAVQLDAAMVAAAPHVRQGPAQLGVPHERWQVVD